MPRPRATFDASGLVAAFAPDGLHGVSAEGLARALGIAKPTLYAHGHTKETLLLLAVEAEVERLLDRLGAAGRATRGRTARDRATAAAEAILAHGAERPDGLRLLARTAAHRRSPVAAEVDAAIARVTDRIARELARDLAGDRLDPELAHAQASALWGAATALSLAFATAGRMPARGRLAALAAAGVPPPPVPDVSEWPAAS